MNRERMWAIALFTLAAFVFSVLVVWSLLSTAVSRLLGLDVWIEEDRDHLEHSEYYSR